MVAAVAYLLAMTASFIGALLVLVWLFGEAPNTTRFQNYYGKKEENEMLMFSGLETQGEIRRLLDELYGGLGQTSAAEAGGLEPEIPADEEPIVEEAINKEPGTIGSILVPQRLIVDGSEQRRAGAQKPRPLRANANKNEPLVRVLVAPLG